MSRTKEQIVEEINSIVEKNIQPSVEMHGGEVSLHSYKDGIATMFMSGACSGCSSSSYTLQQGIQQMLQYYIPEIKGVEKIEDPNSTVDPYYKW